VLLIFLLMCSLFGEPFDKEKQTSAQVQKTMLAKYKLNGNL
jgi:hypothetical protein